MMTRNGAVMAIYKSHLAAEPAIGNCNNICNKMKTKNNIMKMTRLLPLLVATSSVLAISTSLRASDMDDRIESSAAKSYVFKTHPHERFDQDRVQERPWSR
jgi:hypothetical protein